SDARPIRIDAHRARAGAHEPALAIASIRLAIRFALVAALSALQDSIAAVLDHRTVGAAEAMARAVADSVIAFPTRLHIAVATAHRNTDAVGGAAIARSPIAVVALLVPFQLSVPAHWSRWTLSAPAGARFGSVRWFQLDVMGRGVDSRHWFHYVA